MQPAKNLGIGDSLSEHLDRRRALFLLGGASLATFVAACGANSGGSAVDDATSTTGASATTAGSADTAGTAASTECEVIPEETAGPYPGDGSNGPDVLTEDGVVRSDITTSFGSASGTADGVPLTIAFTVLDTANGCVPYEGAAVYAWHCDRDGNYSLYSAGVTDQNYLRGVQPADAAGLVTFTSIFPGCYSGRWPHIHFEVYASVEAATSVSNKLATSQIAIPEDICDEVYATSGYEQSAANLARISLETDNVFRDGWSRELGTMSGSINDGLTVALTVPT